MIKYSWFLSLLTALAFALFCSSSVFAQTPTPQAGGQNNQGDKIVVANTYRLQSGDSLTGNLVVIGGTATVEKGATVTGDIVLIGGTITVDGTLNGNLVAVGGAASLGEEALINGDIVTVGASLKKADTARVTGKITEQTPSITSNNGTGWQFPWKSSQNFLSRLLAVAFESLALAALAVVIGLILPKQTQEITNSLINEPLIAGGVGLLSAIGSPILLLILIITIILIPVGVLFVILVGLAVVFGWIAIGNLLGQRFAKLFRTTWAIPVSAGIGAFVVTLLVGLLNLIPCIGWLVGVILGLAGLGAVVMTRFGSISSSSKPAIPVMPSEPPVSPEPPQIPSAS
jgi:hypothetical protein